jgi:cyclophilin family peptidyl-prolyl cis-trans isomerase
MTHRFRVLIGSVGLSSLACVAAPPVFPPRPDATDVVPNIPCGKTLVLPIAVDDPDGDAVSLTVTSSNPRVFARVRSGNYHYKMRVQTADGAPPVVPAPVPPDPPVPYEGEMEFQLFRAMSPDTAGLIAGIAQSGYYDNVLFHRVIPGFVIQGGDKAGTGSGPSPFTIRHEFRPELIYSGRGQLAMANSQGGYAQSFPSNGNARYRTGSFAATNGTQFFVTLDDTRHLDFKHSVFGQLIRGYDAMDQVAQVKRNASDKPLADVKMALHSVTASKTDAVLLLSAIDTSDAVTITVTATDTTGVTATKAMTVKSVVDGTNTPPILLPFEPVVARVGAVPNFRVRSFDLEHDAISTRFPVRDSFTGQVIYAGLSGGNLLATSPATAGPWDVTIGVAGLNDPLLDVDEFSASRFQRLEIGVGDRAVIATPVSLEATVAVSTGSVPVAAFHHGSPAAQPGDFTVTVNWGDGSALQTNSGLNPPISVVRSASRAGTFEVRGEHTYARAGWYPLHVVVDAASGATGTARGTTVVSNADAILRAKGEYIEARGPVFSTRPVAFFTDITPGAKAADYSVIVDWGDGQRTPGIVRQVAAGRFAVVGSHRYLDAETFSIAVHIRRVSPAAETVAWSTLELGGFAGPVHLPPFAKANITTLWSVPARKIYRGSSTDIEGVLFLLNGGNKNTGRWKLRLWLSNDSVLGAGDTPLKFGPLKRTLNELPLNSLPPGGGGNLPLARQTGSDFTIRLPGTETGAGKYIIAESVYSDPLADKMPVAKYVASGPLPGFVVTPGSLSIKEGTGNPLLSGSFSIRLDTLPTNNVDVSLDIVNARTGAVETARATLSATSLQFTSANGTTGKTVTVTAVEDFIRNTDENYTIRIKPADSTDFRFDGMDAPDVALRIQDNVPTIAVSPTTLTLTEGGGAGTFRVRLTAPPSPGATVTVPLEIVDSLGQQDITRATIQVSQVVLTDTSEVTVTVTVVDDALDNGSGAYTIRLKPATSTDARYNNQDASDVSLTVLDNE